MRLHVVSYGTMQYIMGTTNNLLFGMSFVRMSEIMTLRTAIRERTNAAIERLALMLMKSSSPTENVCVHVHVVYNCYIDDPYT